MAGQTYKRSWKNLLINKSYQLKFTLFMVGLATVLMVGLGFWVMKVANETTAVSIASVRGTPCPIIADLRPDVEESIDLTPPPPPVVTPSLAPPTDLPMQLPEEGQPAPAAPPAAATVDEEPAAADDEAEGEEDSEERPRRAVVMTESTIEMTPEGPPPIIVPPDFGESVARRYICEQKIAGSILDLEAGRMRILYVLIGTGLLLVFGLAIYGIKMTHRVAGPLFKVGLYLAKMRDGRFDKVWNLRKGDQLVDFYEHFKSAHGGIVAMQKDDIAKLTAVISAAEAAGAAEDPQIVKLRDLVAKKEKSLE
jgi:hypothetical protein